jgi:hypothetical protein
MLVFTCNRQMLLASTLTNEFAGALFYNWLIYEEDLDLYVTVSTFSTTFLVVMIQFLIS